MWLFSVTKCCSALLQCLMQKLAERESETDPEGALKPKERFAMLQCSQTAFLLDRKLERKSLTYLHIREYFDNLACLYDVFMERYNSYYASVRDYLHRFN